MFPGRGNDGCFGPPSMPDLPRDPITATVGAIVDGIRTIFGGRGTDPEMIRILEEQQKQNNENYKKEVERRNEERKEHNSKMEKAQREADENLKQMRLDEKENTRKMQEKIDSDQAKFEAEMEKKSKDHKENMAELKKKSMEDWKAADKKHQEETKELRAAHDEEKKNANKQLEEAKKLGLQKIKNAEKARQKIENERFQLNEKFSKDMKEMEEKHLEEKRKLLEERLELKRKSIEERRKQASIENEDTMKKLNQLFKDLKNQQTTESTKCLLGQFEKVVQTIETTQGNLKHLGIYCTSDTIESFKAKIQDNLDSMDMELESFKSRARNFESFKLDSVSVHPEAFRLCNEFLAKFKESMNSEEILSINNLLGPAVKNSNLGKVKELGESSRVLSMQLEKVARDLTLGLNNLTTTFVSTAPAKPALNK